MVPELGFEPRRTPSKGGDLPVSRFWIGVSGQNRTDDKSFADSCLTTWRQTHLNYLEIPDSREPSVGFEPTTYSLLVSCSTPEL